MENISDKDLEQILSQEVQKLKKAISYIEEAQESARYSASLLTKMNSKYHQIECSRLEIDSKLLTIEKKLDEKISLLTSSHRTKYDLNLERLRMRIECIQRESQEEITSLKKLNKHLVYLAIAGIGIAVLSLLF